MCYIIVAIQAVVVWNKSHWLVNEQDYLRDLLLNTTCMYRSATTIKPPVSQTEISAGLWLHQHLGLFALGWLTCSWAVFLQLGVHRFADRDSWFLLLGIAVAKYREGVCPLAIFWKDGHLKVTSTWKIGWSLLIQSCYTRSLLSTDIHTLCWSF